MPSAALSADSVCREGIWVHRGHGVMHVPRYGSLDCGVVIRAGKLIRYVKVGSRGDCHEEQRGVWMGRIIPLADKGKGGFGCSDNVGLRSRSVDRVN